MSYNQAVSPFNPVTASGGTAPLTYSISPALPTGLGINSSTGAISGTPTATSPVTTYTVTVTDANNATLNSTIALSVGKATATVTLSNLSQTYTGSPLAPVITAVPAVGYGVTYTGLAPTNYGPTSTPPTDPGSYSVMVAVTDSNYTGGATGTLVINQLNPALNLAPQSGAPAQPPYGTNLQFELSMASSPVCPTGSVSFYVDGGSQPAYTATLNGTGCATPGEYVEFQTASLTAGTHSITAVYSGDTYYQGATSNQLVQTIYADGTAVTLATSAQTMNVGDSVTFTATVTPSTVNGGFAQAPTGTVSFNEVDNQGNLIGTLNPAPIAVTAGTTYSAAFSTSSLPEGAYNIQAVFADSDGNFLGSSSLVAMETVNLRTPVITWKPNVATIVYGVPLGADQLNATTADPETQAPVAGTFSYAPTAGSVQGVGNPNLQVTFAPADTATYRTQTATVTITVTPAMLTVTADNQSRSYGADNPTFTFQYSGFVNSERESVLTAMPVCSTTATASSPVGTYDVTCSGGAAANYNFNYVKGTLTITGAPLTVTANNAATTYGTSLPPLGGTLTGVVTGDGITASYTTTAMAASPAGTYPITPLLSDPNSKLGDYAVTSTNGTLTIGKASSGLVLQSSAAQVLLKNNVTLTVHVTSITSGTPSGGVNFMDGMTPLGSGTLDNSGTATLTLSTLAAGSHNLAAVYGGDSNFNGSTSTAVSETVQDFQLSGGSVTVLSATVQSGGVATYQLQVTPTEGATFPSAIALSLAGLPPGATYSITPAIIAAGSVAEMVTVQVHTKLTTAAASRKTRTGLPLLACAMLLPMVGMVRMRQVVQSRRKQIALLLLLLLILGILGMSACGTGGSGHFNSAPNTYTMPLNATSGALQHTINLSLTIQ